MAKIQAPHTAFAGPLQKHPRVPNKAHTTFVAGLPCLSCGKVDRSEAHHLKLACPEVVKVSAGTARPHDCFTVPLCRACHALAHNRTERIFWGELTTNPFLVSLALYAFSGDYDLGVQIIQANR